MKIVTYRRVSTEEQAVHGQSLSAQREALTHWAETNGHVLLAEFADEGISAWDTNKLRPGLGDLLVFCRNNPVDLVAVYSFDRFSRDLTQSLLARRELEKYNTRVVSITEPADPDAPEGRLLISILGSFAQFFSDQNSVKTRAAMKHKAAKGKSTGGTTPYGYRLAEGNFIPGPAHEVETVQDIFRMAVVEQLGVKEIVNRLNESGRPGYHNGAWSNSTVGQILKNRVYVGDRVWGKRKLIQTPAGKRRVAVPESEWTIATEAHEPLIARDLYERRQVMAQERGFEQRKQRKRPGFWLLSGLLVCAHCGGGYVGVRKRKKDVDYYHYVCNTRMKKGVAACPESKRYLDARSLEKQVVEAIRDEVIKPDRLERIKEQLKEAFETHRKQNKPPDIRRKLKDTQNRLERLLKAIEEGVCELDDVQGRILNLKNERTRLEAEQMRHGLGDAPLKEAIAFVDDLANRFGDVFDTLSFAARQRAVQSIVSVVEVNQEKDEITIEFAINKNKAGNGLNLSQPWSVLAPQDGLEPPARWLTATCSTD